MRALEYVFDKNVSLRTEIILKIFRPNEKETYKYFWIAVAFGFCCKFYYYFGSLHL